MGRGLETLESSGLCFLTNGSMSLLSLNWFRYGGIEGPGALVEVATIVRELANRGWIVGAPMLDMACNRGPHK